MFPRSPKKARQSCIVYLGQPTEGRAVSFTGVRSDGRIRMDFLDMNEWLWDYRRIPPQDPHGNATFVDKEEFRKRLPPALSRFFK